MVLQSQRIAKYRTENDRNLRPTTVVRDGVASSARPSYFGLTGRELEVLALVSKGLSNQDISVELDIALATVKVHVARILRKMSVRNRTRAALMAIDSGLIQ